MLSASILGAANIHTFSYSIGCLWRTALARHSSSKLGSAFSYSFFRRRCFKRLGSALQTFRFPAFSNLGRDVVDLHFCPLIRHAPNMSRNGRRVLMKRQARAPKEAGSCSNRGRRMIKHLKKFFFFFLFFSHLTVYLQK